MDEREVLEQEQARLAAIVVEVQARLTGLAEQIAREGMMLEGSQGQSVRHPLLREESSARTELRRVSSDLSACELRLAKLPRGPLDRTTDWRDMTPADWRGMPKGERLALWRCIAEGDRRAASEQVPGSIML